jgi:hypothetical protein
MSFRVSRVLCILFAGGCSLIQEPQQTLATRYVLRSIAGARLPAAYAANSLLTAVMTSDTLELRDDGTGAHRTTLAGPGTPQSSSREDTDLRFTRSGNRIAIEITCGIAAVCVRPPHAVGTISADRIVFTESVIWRVPMVFERLP